jgi:hypothetical protein
MFSNKLRFFSLKIFFFLFPLNVFVNKLLNSVFWDKVQFGGGLGVGIGGF